MPAQSPPRDGGPDPIDVDLVRRANDGDRAAFAALYERHRDFVHAVAWRLTQDADLAADVVQETFLWWLGRFPGFELRVRATTFLYTVARSLAMDRVRRRGREPRPLEDEVPPTIPPPAPKRSLDDIVAGLPAGQREVLALRYAHDLSLAEIAEALDIPIGTVKSRLHAANEAVRRAVEASGER